MKRFAAISMFIMMPIFMMAQTKECKFFKIKNDKGVECDAIQVPARFGNLTLWKNEGKLTGSYSAKFLFAVMAQNPANKAILRIDSIKLVFDNNTIVNLRAVGTGTMANTNTQIQPKLDQATFNFLITPQALKAFTEAKLNGFKLVAEKDAQYTDILNEKQKNALVKAFSCVNQ